MPADKIRKIFQPHFSRGADCRRFCRPGYCRRIRLFPRLRPTVARHQSYPRGLRLQTTVRSALSRLRLDPFHPGLCIGTHWGVLLSSTRRRCLLPDSRCGLFFCFTHRLFWDRFFVFEVGSLTWRMQSDNSCGRPDYLSRMAGCFAADPGRARSILKKNR